MKSCERNALARIPAEGSVRARGSLREAEVTLAPSRESPNAWLRKLLWKALLGGRLLTNQRVETPLDHLLRWLVLAIAMVRFYMEKGTHRGLYKSIQKTLKFFQTFALLEIVHCLIGIVPTSVLVTGVQVISRIFMVWLITHSIKPIQNEESVVLFLVAWTVTEITRYSFYTFSLLDHLPYFIKWARYNFFIILYPVGVAGELLTIYAALPYVKKTGMFSIRLPNKYNVSFDYYYFLLITMASYIPLFPQLYFHMLRQRRKVLHGEVIVEKDD
ncbi:PREDICTED: very-long-chain (3R)-3-hydroxyacyl-[acyl-carrier protein] dehydratase 1 [Galeopterus variegatus]|uniref:Very-long-chain (3R)-3-hydroxyacyl-CoA dehydratase n=1 Tax=Galeopterus variegatus TaxID=482537 RepID=A0ABM0RPW6_GALVR|nr:PREDICTED: very-long-chain (3R)-3-hydroxyacyl-[acyl-carrier protein] dehydratase 1 [Galeopterus variegatus]